MPALSLPVVVLVFIICATPRSAAQITPTVLLQGRFAPGQNQANATLPQTFSWPASSVYATFASSSTVSINITALPQNGSITYSINWFRFFVDDQFAADGFTSYNQLNLLVTLNVTNSSHALRVAKMNDGSKGEAILQSISLSPGARFLPPAPPAALSSGKRILFLGDSYSVGYGNAGAVLPNTCTPEPQQLQQDWNETCAALKITVPSECAAVWQVYNQNSMQAFTAVAAGALGADYQIIATSGSGMVGYSYAAESHPGLAPAQYEAIVPTNEALFNRSVYSDSGSLYDLKSWIPQIVVVASGTNDWHSVPPIYTLDQWLTKGAAFLQQISATFNQPTIVIQAWPAEQQLAGALNGDDGLNETVQYMQGMPSLFTEAVRQAVPNVHYLQLTTDNYDNYYDWCDGHPSAFADRVIAQQLTSFISAVQPGWNTIAPINTTIDQVAIRPNTSLYTTNASSSMSTSSAG